MKLIQIKDKIVILDDHNHFLSEALIYEDENIIEIKEIIIHKDGKGKLLANKTMKILIALARIKNKKIKPINSYSISWFKVHEEYKEILLTN